MYSGTYKQKRVTKLAPDAVVRINGDTTIEICPKCKSKISISKYITNLSSSLACNGTIGNAQFTIAMPRHGDDGVYMVRGGKVFGIELMDEVEIFIKGRFQNGISDYNYYKVFWGVIVDIGESYSGGVQTVSVNCESMLKWLQLMKTNEHPAIMALEDTVAKVDTATLLMTGKTYANMTPYQIIYSLVNVTMINMVLPTQLDSEAIPLTAGVDAKEKIRATVAGYGAEKDLRLLAKWRNKFSVIKASLKMFGTSESSFVNIDNAKQDEAKNKIKPQDFAGKTKNTPQQIFYNTQALMDFKPFSRMGTKNSEMGLISSTYKNNLEIATEVCVMTGFEFYLDTNGDIIFKPPFWNVDTRENPVYVIKDEDIVGWDFKESEEGVITRYEVTGGISQAAEITSEVGVPRGIFTNYNWARHFGMRSQQITMSMFTTARMCYFHAISEMDRVNANRYKGSLTIVGRPELKLGMPVYIESRDIFGYLENINHNFTFGGPYQTQIQLSAIRKKYFGDDPMSAGHDFKKTGDSFQNYEYKGDAVILLYKGESNSLKEFETKVNPKDKDRVKNAAEGAPKQSTAAAEGLRKDVRNTVVSNRSGVYEEVSLHDQRAKDALAKADLAKETSDRDSYMDFLEMAIPVSDEDGYELVGIYENGRSLYLAADGTLKKKGRSFSQILENRLNEATGDKNTYFGTTLTQVNVINDPTDNATWVKDYRDNPDPGDNTAKEIKNYFKDKAVKLAQIAPEKDKSITRGCSCYDVALTGVSVKNRVSSGNKQALVSNSTKK